MPNFGTGLTTRERALAWEITQVNIFQDFITLEYEQEKLSRYSVEWQLDERHLARGAILLLSPSLSISSTRALAGGLGRVVRDHSQRAAYAPPETQKPTGGDATVIAS